MIVAAISPNNMYLCRRHDEPGAVGNRSSIRGPRRIGVPGATALKRTRGGAVGSGHEKRPLIPRLDYEPTPVGRPRGGNTGRDRPIARAVNADDVNLPVPAAIGILVAVRRPPRPEAAARDECP